MLFFFCCNLTYLIVVLLHFASYRQCCEYHTDKLSVSHYDMICLFQYYEMLHHSVANVSFFDLS